MEAIDLAPETYPIAFLTRISPRGREPKTFLMSDITNGNGLKFKVSLNTSVIYFACTKKLILKARMLVIRYVV